MITPGKNRASATNPVDPSTIALEQRKRQGPVSNHRGCSWPLALSMYTSKSLSVFGSRFLPIRARGSVFAT